MGNDLFERFYAFLIYDEEADYDWVIRVLSEHLETNPSNAMAYNNRAVAYREIGQAEDALADFAEAIRLAPSAPSPVKNRGSMWLEMGKPSLEDFTHAIQLAPDFRQTYQDRALVLEQLGEFNQAEPDRDAAPGLENEA